MLSACETGLGTVAGGEGVFGLQRAFHLAGAQTVVASLWSVNLEATGLLMAEFYKNLWGNKLPKLEALRQAQLTMIKAYRRHAPGGPASAAKDPTGAIPSSAPTSSRRTSGPGLSSRVTGGRVPLRRWRAWPESGRSRGAQVRAIEPIGLETQTLEQLLDRRRGLPTSPGIENAEMHFHKNSPAFPPCQHRGHSA